MPFGSLLLPTGSLLVPPAFDFWVHPNVILHIFDFRCNSFAKISCFEFIAVVRVLTTCINVSRHEKFIAVVRVSTTCINVYRHEDVSRHEVKFK